LRPSTCVTRFDLGCLHARNNEVALVVGAVGLGLRQPRSVRARRGATSVSVTTLTDGGLNDAAVEKSIANFNERLEA
jgi:hypothetical protein